MSILSKIRLFSSYRDRRLRQMIIKVCRGCKIEKNLVEFGKKSQSKDGFNVSCKECVKAIRRKSIKKIKNIMPTSTLSLIEKSCKKCGVMKPSNAFNRNFSTKDRLHNWCRECINKTRKIRPEFADITHKWCKGCLEEKSVSSFHKSGVMRDGYQSICWLCHKVKYGIGTEVWKKHQSDLRKQDWVKYILKGARQRAKENCIPYDIEHTDIKVPAICPILGIELAFSSGGKSPNSPSLDRVIPSKGYVRGNVRIISWRANRLKMNETDPRIFEAIAAYLRQEAISNIENTQINCVND